MTSETSVPSLLGTILTWHNVAKAFKVHTGLLYLKHCCDLFASLLMEACACARTHFTVLSVEICALRMQKGHYCLQLSSSLPSSNICNGVWPCQHHSQVAARACCSELTDSLHVSMLSYGVGLCKESIHPKSPCWKLRLETAVTSLLTC